MLPISNNITLYDNFTYGIKIKYPVDWIINTPPAIVSDSNGSNNNNFITIVEFSPHQNQNSSQDYSPYVMVSIQFIDTNLNLDKYIDHVISVARSSLENFNLIEASTNATLSAHESYMLVYSYTVNGTTFKNREIGTIIYNNAYIINYNSEARRYYNLYPVVQKMIDSFQIDESKAAYIKPQPITSSSLSSQSQEPGTENITGSTENLPSNDIGPSENFTQNSTGEGSTENLPSNDIGPSER